MTPQELLDRTKFLASVGPSKYQTPTQQQVDYGVEASVALARKVGANENVVRLGSLLMDCELGEAMKQGKASQHTQMAIETTKKFLDDYPDLSEEVKTTIIACVAEHHGVNKFSSIESEVCCNGDCYKFASIDGFLISLRFMRDMPINEQLRLLLDKLEEKWSALTLDVCKLELKPEYDLIKTILSQTKLK